MRLVSWNCCDAFERKFGHLERLQPDVAVIQEVRPECMQFAGVEDRSAWIGHPDQKGLCVVPYGDWKIVPVSIAVSEQWFLPLALRNGSTLIHLVAVWVDSSHDCVKPTLRALAQLREFLHVRPSIIAGDFNQTVALDRGRPPGAQYADVLRELDSLGMVSAWHGVHEEAQGKESAATLYWRWNEQAKYHIDYAFASPDLRPESATLGSFDQYVRGAISDHVPLIVDYAIT